MKLDKSHSLTCAVTLLIIFSTCNAQRFGIEIDPTPHIQRIEAFYSRLNRGAQNLMNWPVIYRIPHKNASPVYAQPVVFSGGNNINQATSDDQVMLTSGSENVHQIVRPHGVSSDSNGNSDLYTYVNGILQQTYPSDATSLSSSSNGHGYSPASYSSPPSHSHLSHSPGGSYFTGGHSSASGPGPRWASRGPPPPPPPHGGGWRRPPPPRKLVYEPPRGPPPPKQYNPWGPPTKTIVTHTTSSGWAPSIPVTSGWTSTPVKSIVSKANTKGWGWSKKCDPLAEPPFIINSISDIPLGSNITTGDDRPASISDLPSSAIPIPPVTLTAGVRAALPPNYTHILTEQYNIRINPDGSTNFNRNEVHNNANYKPPMTPPPQKRNYVQITSTMAKSPFVSVPLDGVSSPNFNAGLQDRNSVIREPAPHPFKSQIDTLLRLFNEIESFENNEGHKAQVQSEGPGSRGNTLAPLVLMQVQRFAIPEPNSSEAGVLDSAYNFGPQASRVSFGDLDLVTDGWKTQSIAPGPALDTSSLGATEEEALNTWGNWVRGYVKALREASAASYDRVEEMSYNLFEQHQYFIYPPTGCGQPIDPQKLAGPFSSNCALGSVSPEGPAPSCFPPRCR